MKIARIAVLAVALGAAGGAAMLARSILPGAQVADVTEQMPQLQTEEVLVATRDVALGSRVESPDLRWQSWPAEALSERYITRANRPDAARDTVNMIARAPLMQGEPITLGKLVSSDQGGFMSAILDRGRRAISIRISPETGAGGFILPNDRVDVILTKEQTQGADGGGGYSSETILTNVRVLAIDQAISEEDGRQVVVGKTATLELAPEQTEVLALGERRGELSLALRSLADASDDAGYRHRPSSSVNVVRFGVSTQITTTR
jgi:pilus assembly protein CpaB